MTAIDASGRVDFFVASHVQDWRVSVAIVAYPVLTLLHLLHDLRHSLFGVFSTISVMDANIQADGQAKWCEWYAAAQSGDNGHNPRPMRRSAARDARAIPEWNRFTPHDREQICLNMHARQQIVNNFQARQQRMEDDADLADVARANGDFKRYMDINNDLVLRYRDMADNDLDPDGALGPSTRNIIQLVRPSVPSGDRVVNCINRLLNQWHIQMNAKANEHHGRALHPRLTPRHYNGVCKIHENWQVYFHELRRRVRRLDAFKDGDPYPQHPAAMIGAWMGAYILRRSDLANVGMWVWIVNGRVKDRAVRKDTYVDRASWSDVTMWQNIDYNSNGLRIPLEVVNLHRLTLGHGVQPPSVPRLRAWRVYRDAMMYSITYDYSPFGTMHDLVVRILHREPENRRYIPEPFLWRTISAIAQVGFAMHGLDPVTQVVDPVYLGKRIVHRNIALGKLLWRPCRRASTCEVEKRGADLGASQKTYFWTLPTLFNGRRTHCLAWDSLARLSKHTTDTTTTPTCSSTAEARPAGWRPK